MPDILRLGPADLLRVRFAVSPLFETTDAVRLLDGLGGEGRRRHAAWLEAVGPGAGAGLEGLRALHGPRGYVPDFVGPPPRRPGPTAGEQIAEVRPTPLEHVRTELTMCLETRWDSASRPLLEQLVRDPEMARERLA